jgi:N6-L-threonylcarbamoyladenine synthase
LGIETSCDDTAAAVLAGGDVRSSVVSSQDSVHGAYGGVVPELASREHVRNLLPVMDAALERGGVTLDDLDAIAVTRGPGLIGSLLVGLSAAKGVALARNLPLVGVNHLEGPLLSALLAREMTFPFLALLVSGGHTSLYLARALGSYALLGKTRDDAAGEAFDKAAKLLGLGYPGGRAIDGLARGGDPVAVRFPRAKLKRESYDFSFSGLKTAVRQHISRTDAQSSADVAASVQEAIVDMLVETTCRAANDLGLLRIAVVGGVSANSRLRARFAVEAAERGLDIVVPPAHLCTDNAAMIAYAGWCRFERGMVDDLDVGAEAALSLEPGWLP